MAKRYYISRVVGNGTDATPYTSELREYIYANWPNEPHLIKQVIAHVIPWCIHKYDLSLVAHNDVMANLTGIFSFPVGVLSKTVGEFPQETRITIRDKLESIGFDFSWATSTTTVREILNYLFHSIQIAEWLDIQITNKVFDTRKTFGNLSNERKDIIRRRLEYAGIGSAWLIDTLSINDVVMKFQQNEDGSPRLFGNRNPRRYLYFDEDDS